MINREELIENCGNKARAYDDIQHNQAKEDTMMDSLISEEKRNEHI